MSIRKYLTKWLTTVNTKNLVFMKEKGKLFKDYFDDVDTRLENLNNELYLLYKKFDDDELIISTLDQLQSELYLLYEKFDEGELIKLQLKFDKFKSELNDPDIALDKLNPESNRI